jgi:TonB family protein
MTKFAAYGLVFALWQDVIAPSWPTHWPDHFDDLQYPLEALERGEVGIVVVRITTDTNGRVESAAVVRGSKALGEAALDNAKTWRLSTGRHDGAIVFRFEIDPGLCNDSRRTLFRLAYPNMAVVTACRARSANSRATHEAPLQLVSHGPAPRYPHLARQARVSGVVPIEVAISSDGRVTPSALTNLPLLTETALAHARQWQVRASAATKEIVVYEFALDNHSCESETNSVFWIVAPGHVRLSGCPPGVQPH